MSTSAWLPSDFAELAEGSATWIPWFLVIDSETITNQPALAPLAVAGGR